MELAAVSGARGDLTEAEWQSGASDGIAAFGANMDGGPQFMRPASDSEFWLARSGEAEMEPDSRDIFIKEEVEVLRLIYGDDAVVSDCAEHQDGQTCWNIWLASHPWNLHVLIPSGCKYPWACPLLRPRHDDQRLSAEQMERVSDALGAASRRNMGEAFMFALVDSLQDVEL